jgi:cytidylate kinase
MIVTIDGPAGVGKSTVTLALAARHGFEYLDTGAMYRAVALAMLRRNIDVTNESLVTAALPDVTIEMPPGRVLLNGENVAKLIRTPELSLGSSAVSKHTAVREKLVRAQRQSAHGRDIVCEGRDQGTVVFPTAECKIFLTGSAHARAERRAAELNAKGTAITVEQVLAEQAKRDHDDAVRNAGPMVPAHDAMILDTTLLTMNEVIERLDHVVRDIRSCLLSQSRRTKR